MIRENKYLVFKLKDTVNLLTPLEQDILDLLAQKITIERAFQRGKKELTCVVVEDDWPEYEQVWSMIEKRVDGAKNDA